MAWVVVCLNCERRFGISDTEAAAVRKGQARCPNCKLSLLESSLQPSSVYVPSEPSAGRVNAGLKKVGTGPSKGGGSTQDEAVPKQESGGPWEILHDALAVLGYLIAILSAFTAFSYATGWAITSGYGKDSEYGWYISHKDILDELRQEIEATEKSLTENLEIVDKKLDVVTKNQDAILKNQDTITKNQDTIMKNQDIINENLRKLVAP